MLTLATEQADQVANLMHCPGAFAWWYADLVDDGGRGLVLIGSFGLPFLPGSRNRPTPAERPSLSLVLYEGGRATFYALQTFEPEDAAYDPSGIMRFGRSRVVLRGGSGAREGDVELRAEIDLDVPGGGRLVGTLCASGAGCRVPSGVSARGASHRWAPIVVGQRGVARLEASDGASFAIEGRIYVDSNGSARPLHELGIADWRWGRVALPDRELIYYFVDPEGEGAPIRHVLVARPDGALVAQDASVRWSNPRRSVYGLGYHRHLHLSNAPDLDVTLTLRRVVDDGPFYLRFLVDAEDRAHGTVGRGFAERVVPDRVDRPWQRPFVRMRTFATAGDNSMWLPLFSGPRRGRFERLLNHWRSTPALEEVAR